MRRTAFGLILAMLAVFLPQGASPARAAGCEGIDNAFAYNECLARTGPQRSTARRARAGGNSGAIARKRVTGRYNPAVDDSGPGVFINRGRSRTSAVIDPWRSSRKAAPQRGRTWLGYGPRGYRWR